MKRESVYLIKALCEDRDCHKQVVESKVKAQSYDDAKQKTHYAMASQGWTVLRFIDGQDDQSW